MKPHFLLVPALLGSMCLVGCSEQEPAVPANGESAALTITVDMEPLDYGSVAQSRAIGHQGAVSNEGKIHDAILFVYTRSMSDAINNRTKMEGTNPTIDDYSDDYPVMVKDIALSANGSSYKSAPIGCELPAGQYYAFAVANANGINAASFSGKNLQQILGYIYTGDLCTGNSLANIKGADRFTMMSTGEIAFTIPEEAEGDISLGTLTMRRLAARIDVSFGTLTPDAHGNIEIPVYDYASYKSTPSELVLTGDTYVLSGIELDNVLTCGTYMIQRTSDGYFRDENIVSKTVDGVYIGLYANKTTQVPSNACEKLTYTFTDLMKDANNLYTSGSDKYYTLPYFPENSSTNKTIFRLKGTYTCLSDLADNGSTEQHDMEFKIRHCEPAPGQPIVETRAMAYGVGRNTIYRIKLDRVYADRDKVYVEWYYDSNNDGTYDKYETDTPFGKYIIDGNDSPVD